MSSDQRYYSYTYGRFRTPDPAGLSAVNLANPISWNRYAYVGDDPVNFDDPRGLEDVLVGDDFGDGGGGGPVWWCSANDPTCFSDPGACIGGNSFAPGPVGCAAQGGDYGPPPPPSAVAEQQPECEAELKYRPLTGLGKVVANHSFWFVEDQTGEDHIVSGGPNPPNPPPNGAPQYLDVYDVPGQSNGDDNKSQKTWFDTGLTAAACSGVDKLLAAADSFPVDKIIYSAFKIVGMRLTSGPNSNSVANYLGQAGGFVGVTAPPKTYGWRTAIPFP